MSITNIKKNFLRKISVGIHTLMASSYLSDEIGIQPFGDIECFIRNKFIIYDTNAIGTPRHWFSDSKFDIELDTISDTDLINFLLYLDNVDIYLKRVYHNAYLSYEDMNEQEYEIVKMIEGGRITFFKDFLDLKI
jgi:hypothetical protein